MGMFDGIGDALSGVTSAIGGVVDPIQGLVTGGLSMLGGTQANNASWDRQMASQNFNAQQTQAQMDFQERMRKTQYQTSVQDLMAAGLNPMLAYTQGGAGTPSGASAQSQAQPVHDVITPAITASLSAKMNAADLLLKVEQTKSTNAQTEVARTQALANIADTARKNQDTATGSAVEQVNIKQLDQIASQIELNKQSTATSSALAGKTRAETKNVITNEAPSGDPFWYRDLKNFGKSGLEAWKNKVQNTNKYLKGN